ncbi:MAG: YitT family protein [Acidaminococcales bacterium]|jgi:uncharacterized membrane-anchored protein YitT (DUF2179 family)|nr:YitT family protein [Acidaminococcales bacterium]
MLKTQITRYAMITLGAALCSAAINIFYIPNNMLSSGVGGVSMILYFTLGLPMSAVNIAANAPLFIFAYRLMNRSYVLASLYGMFVFAFSLDAFRFMSYWRATDDLLLAALCGGLGNGVGGALMYRVNGGSGGTDIISAILNKFYGISYGTVSYAINSVIMVVCVFLFGLQPAAYTFIAIYIAARATDKVTAGFDNKKSILIVSALNDEIAWDITREIGRGVTFLFGEGAYTGQRRKVVFVVIKLTQIARVKNIVYRHDPQAFMIVQEATDVMGKGFTLKSDRELSDEKKRVRLKNIARIHKMRLELEALRNAAKHPPRPD